MGDRDFGPLGLGHRFVAFVFAIPDLGGHPQSGGTIQVPGLVCRLFGLGPLGPLPTPMHHAEQPPFNRIVFGAIARVVAHPHRQPGGLCELPQPPFEHPGVDLVTAPTIAQHQDLMGVRPSGPTMRVPIRAQRVRGKHPCVPALV